MKLTVIAISRNSDGSYMVSYRSEEPFVSLLMAHSNLVAVESEWEFTPPIPLRQREDFEVQP